jgi:hypothetical protein
MSTYTELINTFLKRFTDLISEDITYFECKKGFTSNEYVFKITADNNEFIGYLYTYEFIFEDNENNKDFIETSLKMYVPYKNQDTNNHFNHGDWYWIKDTDCSYNCYVYDKINKTLIMN